MKLRTVLSAIALLCLLAVAAAAADVPGMKRDFTYKWETGYVDVFHAGKLAARYVYKDTPRPYIYPVTSPEGVKVTRSFPVETVAGEARDHPHQRSFWIGFGDVNGIDFWTEGEKSGRIVQTSIDFSPISPGYWAIHTKNDWIGPDGQKICEDERRVSFLSCDYGTIISTMLKISALHQPLKFGDTKEGFFALRVAQGMQVKDGTGHIVNSEGNKDQDAWGKSAKWCDYTGEVGGKTVGITVFDSPTNHGYPTYWQVQDYGLFAANPFGGATFTNDPKNTSTLEIRPYDTKVFVYVALIHDGKLDAEALKSMAPMLVGEGSGAPPVVHIDEQGNPLPVTPGSK